MRFKLLNEAMTKLEQTAKRQIIRVLQENGYPTYAKLASLFDINLTADPGVVGFMEPGKARIVLNKDLSIDQVSTIIRHEILHEYLVHAIRAERLAQKDTKFKNIPHDLVNIAADYEISNRGYTDADKRTVRTLTINDQLMRGLVTEDDHNDWVDLTFEEMLDRLVDEYAEDISQLKEKIRMMGSQGDPSIQEAEEIERQANAIADDDDLDDESREKAQQLADDAQQMADNMKDKEAGAQVNSQGGKVFKSDAEQKAQIKAARKMAEFYDELNKIKEDAKSKNSVDALDQENIDAKQIEKKKNQQKELDRYRNSPIVRFRESLNKFIKNEVQFNRESTWRKYNKKYGEIGVLRPGKTNVMSPVPLINVYVDRSGSWDASKTEEGIKAIATLNKYVRQGLVKLKLYYFSNNVHQEEQDAINEGGTDGQPILNHIAKTKPTNVIIMTDSDISDCRTNTTVPGGVWLLFYGGRSQNLIDHLQGKMMTRIFDMQ